MEPPDDEQSTALLHQLKLSPSPKATFLVAVESGSDRGRSLTVDGASASEMIVGTSPACELQLTDVAISRRHIALDVVGDGLRVRDLRSKNGTLIGELRVMDVLLAGGELIAIGNTALRVT